MKVVVVDDEFLALEGLKVKLSDIEDVEVVGLFEDVDVFLSQVCSINPDVVLLDIDMPKLNGFEVLEKLMDMNVSPHIIFVTASKDHAIQAFEVSAIDYLVKPASRERLNKALDKVRSQVAANRMASAETRNKTVEEQFNLNQHMSHSENTVERNQDLDSLFSLRCFGTFSLSLHGEELNTGWRTRKSEELLAYLVCEKGRYVAKDKIADALWPDDDSARCMASFHVAFYYLKQLEKRLGVMLPVDSKRGKVRLVLERIHCDLLAFDEVYERIYEFPGKTESLHKATNNTVINNKTIQRRNEKAFLSQLTVEHVQLMEHAVSLYQGALLEDRYYDWVAAQQHEYEIKCESLLVHLMNYYQQVNETKFRFYQTLFQTKFGDVVA